MRKEGDLSLNRVLAATNDITYQRAVIVEAEVKEEQGRPLYVRDVP